MMKPDISSIEAYRAKETEYDERAGSSKRSRRNATRLAREYDELRKRRLDEFMTGFNVISLRLKEMYQMITLGGDAELELVDSLDPFSEGIVFSVRPPKKSWKNIANLSGGEKTLSSLALVFALHHYKPTPLYVMDEIDAALDFQERLHRRALHQGAYEERAVCHHLAARTTCSSSPTASGGHLQDEQHHQDGGDQPRRVLRRGG